MADATYTVPVYVRQGSDQLVVGNGGAIKVETGGSILPNSGTKAANVAAFTSSANMSAAQIAKINAIRVALINVGILATG
jgi:hypothetical protein